MDETFNTEENQMATRGDQEPVAPYDAQTSNGPFHHPVPAYAPYPVHPQQDYRGYDMGYDHQNGYPQSWGSHHSHMQPDNQSPEHTRYMHNMCNRYKYYLMQCEGTDGQVYDGIIDNVSDDGVYLLLPVGDTDGDVHGDISRQFGYGYNYGYGGYGYPRRFRRFRRRFFPFFSLRRLFFPFFY